MRSTPIVADCFFDRLIHASPITALLHRFIRSNALPCICLQSLAAFFICFVGFIWAALLCAWIAGCADCWIRHSMACSMLTSLAAYITCASCHAFALFCWAIIFVALLRFMEAAFCGLRFLPICACCAHGLCLRLSSVPLQSLPSQALLPRSNALLSYCFNAFEGCLRFLAGVMEL